MYIYVYIYTYTDMDIQIHSCMRYLYTNIIIMYSYMGWLRSVGALKLQVSFAEYRLFYRALLQKRPIILRSLLIEATP